jgi:hypothetical protein
MFRYPLSDIHGEFVLYVRWSLIHRMICCADSRWGRSEFRGSIKLGAVEDLHFAKLLFAIVSTVWMRRSQFVAPTNRLLGLLVEPAQ